jgi:transcriptional/translational regulatory protein YebC/TACO1
LSKGLVYRLSQKCLEQAEENNNLIKNIVELQEVIKKKQTEINRKRAEINQLKSKLIDKNKKLNICKSNYERIQQEEIIHNFSDIQYLLEKIVDKVQNDKEIQKKLFNYLADQGELIKIFRV